MEASENEDADPNAKTTTTYYPILEYQINDRTISGQSHTGSTSQIYNLNDKIDILYNPSNEEEFIIRENNSNIFAILAIIIGLSIFIIGIIKK